jgi:hypothetical protein
LLAIHLTVALVIAASGWRHHFRQSRLRPILN